MSAIDVIYKKHDTFIFHFNRSLICLISDQIILGVLRLSFYLGLGPFFLVEVLVVSLEDLYRKMVHMDWASCPLCKPKTKNSAF